MPHKSRFRTSVVTGGALLILGCFLVACLVSWLFLSASPNVFGEGRLWIVLPLVPLTALAITVAGTKWTRRVFPSSAESVGALLIVEFIILGTIAFAGGALFMSTTFLFWIVVSLAFAPWWLLGVWIGRPKQRQRYR